MSLSGHGSSTKDSKSRDPSIPSTTKIETIMVSNPSIVETVCPSSTQSVDPLVYSTANLQQSWY